jgi:hypothetical protein
LGNELFTALAEFSAKNTQTFLNNLDSLELHLIDGNVIRQKQAQPLAFSASVTPE